MYEAILTWGAYRTLHAVRCRYHSQCFWTTTFYPPCYIWEVFVNAFSDINLEVLVNFINRLIFFVKFWLNLKNLVFKRNYSMDSKIDFNMMIVIVWPLWLCCDLTVSSFPGWVLLLDLKANKCYLGKTCILSLILDLYILVLSRQLIIDNNEKKIRSTIFYLFSPKRAAFTYFQLPIVLSPLLWLKQQHLT